METVISNYKPTAPAMKLHSSDARIIVCVGGLGSGKSFAVVKEIEQSAIQWPKMPMAMYRKTMPALRDSTLKEFMKHVDPILGKYKYREDTFNFLGDSYMNFRGLDEATKAKSTNYALVVMEEAEEFTIEEFRRLNERIREKGDWPLRLILVLNPVDEEHWIYDQFVQNKAAWDAVGGCEVIHFSTYDNIENLPEGYIDQVTVGMTADEIDRYINGNWGTLQRGEPVFSKMLRPDLHLRKVDLEIGMILLRGWDFGFNHPAISFRVVDKLGRMNTKHEMLGDKEDLIDFAPKVLHRTNLLFPPDMPVFDFGDPRGHDKAQNGKGTCFETLREFGIHAIGERGSREYVEEGIRQMKKEFSTLIEGVPKHTIDPSCTIHRAGFFGKYIRDLDGRPKKDGYYEHVMDSSRYISHHHKQADAIANAITQSKVARQSRNVLKNRFTGYGRHNG